MIWRTCLNHNGSFCHPEVRWCEFYADPPAAAFNAIDDFCRACGRSVVLVQEDRCSFCGKSGLRWAARRKVATTGPEAEMLYRYTCSACGRETYSRNPLEVAEPRPESRPRSGRKSPAKTSGSLTAPASKKAKGREAPARRPR